MNAHRRPNAATNTTSTAEASVRAGAAKQVDADSPGVKYNKPAPPPQQQQQQRRRRRSSKQQQSDGSILPNKLHSWLFSASSSKKHHHHHHSAAAKNSSVPAILGFCIIFISLITVWQFIVRQFESKARQERLQRQARAERLWEERNYDAPHNINSASSSRRLEQRLQHAFAQEKMHLKETGAVTAVRKLLKEWLTEVDQQIIHNHAAGGPRWIRPYLLPPLPGSSSSSIREKHADKHHPGAFKKRNNEFYNVQRSDTQMSWKAEWEALDAHTRQQAKPAVDYTQSGKKYHYPDLLWEPPAQAGSYPALSTLQQIMERWHQDEDFSGEIQETLLHFNYSNPDERAAAELFRNAEVPFKLYDVPEVTAAGLKWTDDYVTANFDHHHHLHHANTRSSQTQQHHADLRNGPAASGVAQESPNNYFAFFNPPVWELETMGLPPTRNNDWTFHEWSQHARYSDAIALRPDQPHFYWQAGVPPDERHHPVSQWSFISRDLPMLSSPNATFFVFHPEKQKGIQCRFGERGVVAATHYDSGRNMVAMITGAKRYILSPPNQCSKLGIFTTKKNPVYRHSLLNFGHIRYLTDAQAAAAADDNYNDGSYMSAQERAWLERAASSMVVETVLKAGEVLYIPSHWFHYIISLQKSAQCNARSGVDKIGTVAFGGLSDVERCQDD